MSLHWTDLTPDHLAALVVDDPQQFRPGLVHPRMGPPNAVAVLVDDIGAGVWARFTGTRDDGTPVTVTGACVGGPDIDPLGDVFAVQVRTYRPGEEDLVVYIGAGCAVLLVDDPGDWAARARQALAPVFGPAERAELIEWVPDKPGSKKGRWVDLPPVHNPTAAELAALEASSVRDIQMSAVHRGHLPVGAVDKTQTRGNLDTNTATTKALEAPMSTTSTTTTWEERIAAKEQELAAATAAFHTEANRPAGCTNMRAKQHGRRIDAQLKRAGQLRTNMQRLERELAAMRQQASEPPRAPLDLTRLPFAAFIRTDVGWYKVLKVNKVTVKVVNTPGMDDLIKISKIVEIREQRITDTNNDGWAQLADTLTEATA
jgi:hypothetical protein